MYISHFFFITIIIISVINSFVLVFNNVSYKILYAIYSFTFILNEHYDNFSVFQCLTFIFIRLYHSMINEMCNK